MADDIVWGVNVSEYTGIEVGAAVVEKRTNKVVVVKTRVPAFRWRTRVSLGETFSSREEALQWAVSLLERVIESKEEVIAILKASLAKVQGELANG